MSSDGLSLGDQKTVATIMENKKEEVVWKGYLSVITSPKEKKADKKTIVVGKWRLYIINRGKLEKEIHFLEITKITSKGPSKIDIFYKSGGNNPISCPDGNESSITAIIETIVTSHCNIFPGIPLSDRFDLILEPDSRLDYLSDLTGSVDVMPLGSMLEAYNACCELINSKPRDDIIWDLENLFIPGEVKDFNLGEFEQPLDGSDVSSLMGSLSHNTWFATMSIKGIQLDRAMIRSVAECLSSNVTFEDLTLKKVGLSKDTMSMISDALSSNKGLALTSFVLSGNILGDPGMTSFASYISSMTRGLVKLDVSNCGAAKVGMSALCKSLSANVHMANTLLYFNISGNKLDNDGSAQLGNFLAQPNQLKQLKMRGCNATLGTLLSAVLRGCHELSELDISFNKFTKKEDFVSFIKGANHLSSIDLSGTSTPFKDLEHIIKAVAENAYLKDFAISATENKLGPQGARMLAMLSEQLHNVTKLDLSDNELGDEGISILAEGFTSNTSLKWLSLNHNFVAKTKNRKAAIDSLNNLLNSECPLEYLSLQGKKGAALGDSLCLLLYDLGTQEGLKFLDISFNQSANKGANALGRCLQTNTSLETLRWDGNLTTLTGFENFLTGLKKNKTLKNMEMPVFDISQLGRDLNACQPLLSKIEASLRFNQSPTAKLGKSSGRGTSSFGFLSSGTREEMQKMTYKIKSTGRKIPDWGKETMAEVAKQDEIMMGLFNTMDAACEGLDQEIRAGLINGVKVSYPAYSKAKGQLIEELVSMATQSYKSLDQEVVKRLRPNLSFGGKDLLEEEFEEILVQAAGSELTTKARDAFHGIATIASDYLYEKLTDELRDIHEEIESQIREERRVAEEEAEGVVKPKRGKETPKKKEKEKPKKAPKVPKRPPVSASTKPADITKVKTASSNLTHAQKAKPTLQAKRRPPTRKKRPPPPSLSQM